MTSMLARKQTNISCSSSIGKFRRLLSYPIYHRKHPDRIFLLENIQTYLHFKTSRPPIRPLIMGVEIWVFLVHPIGGVIVFTNVNPYVGTTVRRLGAETASFCLWHRVPCHHYRNTPCQNGDRRSERERSPWLARKEKKKIENKQTHP